MGKTLAIDFGAKRCGLAITDSLKMIASPFDVVATQDLLTYLKKAIPAEGIDEVVIGKPNRLHGDVSEIEFHILGFIKRLTKEFDNMLIVREDERFTSIMALDAMIAAGTSKKQRQEKGNIDKVSAAIILQSYLERKSKNQ